MRWSAERREFAINTLLGAAWITLGALLTAWCLAAIAVGSVVIGRWIGGIG